MSRRLLALAAVVAAVLTAVPAALGAAGPRLVEVGNVRFPDRAFALTLPRPARLAPDAVQVRENGRPIANVGRVQAQNAAVGRFGVVLVLDASQSMLGKPIEGAVAAARAFAKQRAANQLFGLVTFNARVDVALQPTTDSTAIDQALASPPALAYGTYIYDAVASAISILQRSKVTVGSVIVLSDGADTGSRLPLRALTARANAAHIRVFSVGLHSYQFRAGTLRKLASKTSAAYSEATSPKALTPIYQALSQQLGSEYLLQYRSAAGPGQLVHVAVTVAGFGTAVASYRTPELPVTPLPPFHRSFLDRIWLSPLTTVVVALAFGLLAAFVLLTILRVGQYSLRERMSQFVTILSPEERLKASSETVTRQVDALDRALESRAWWGRFKEDLEIAQIKVPAARLITMTALASIVLAWLLGYAITPIFALVGLIVPPVFVRAVVKRKLSARRELFTEQLPDNLNVLASALRAGHSFIGALSVMVTETEEPSRTEFRRVISDEQLGMPAEEALMKVAVRMENDDLEQVALVAALQRQMGGNTAEVLDTVVDTIRERFDLRRLVKTLTAQARITRWVLTGLPIGVGFFIALINPTYVKPLYTTGTGQVLLVLAAVMVASGSVVIARLANIKI